MLPLDSPAWPRLEHAYGSAADTPQLLSRLGTGDEQALQALYDSIFHQGSVYPASIAAFPHLVGLAGGAPVAWRAQLLLLAGGIHSRAQRIDFGGDVPAEIRTGHGEALARALELTLGALPEVADSGTAVYLLQSAAAFSGWVTLGHQLQGLVDQELLVSCPACDVELYVWPDGQGLRVAAEEPVRNRATRFLPIVPASALDEVHAARRQRLAEWCAAKALAPYRGQVDALFGTGECPSCGTAFSLIEQLEARDPA